VTTYGNDAGFTLLEVLMALSIFALISGISYTALGPAGDGFKQLQDVRDSIDKISWLGKQLRSDVSSASGSSLTELIPIKIITDNRGGSYVDDLTLLIKEPGRGGLTLVHYRLNEEKHQLMRASRIAWASQGVKGDLMLLGDDVTSFHVEQMDSAGKWRQRMPVVKNADSFVWPQAIRIRIQQHGNSREWVLPLFPD